MEKLKGKNGELLLVWDTTQNATECFLTLSNRISIKVYSIIQNAVYVCIFSILS